MSLPVLSRDQIELIKFLTLVFNANKVHGVSQGLILISTHLRILLVIDADLLVTNRDHGLALVLQPCRIANRLVLILSCPWSCCVDQLLLLNCVGEVRVPCWVDILLVVVVRQSHVC